MTKCVREPGREVSGVQWTPRTDIGGVSQVFFAAVTNSSDLDWIPSLI